MTVFREQNAVGTARQESDFKPICGGPSAQEPCRQKRRANEHEIKCPKAMTLHFAESTCMQVRRVEGCQSHPREKSEATPLPSLSRENASPQCVTFRNSLSSAQQRDLPGPS